MMCTYMSRELIKISSLVKPAPLFHWWWWSPNTARVHLSSLSTHYHHLALPCPYTPRHIEAVFVERESKLRVSYTFLFKVSNFTFWFSPSQLVAYVLLVVFKKERVSELCERKAVSNLDSSCKQKQTAVGVTFDTFDRKHDLSPSGSDNVFIKRTGTEIKTSVEKGKRSWNRVL